MRIAAEKLTFPPGYAKPATVARSGGRTGGGAGTRDEKATLLTLPARQPHVTSIARLAT
jgi:hypothetical protein